MRENFFDYNLHWNCIIMLNVQLVSDNSDEFVFIVTNILNTIHKTLYIRDPKNCSKLILSRTFFYPPWFTTFVIRKRLFSWYIEGKEKYML